MSDSGKSTTFPLQPAYSPPPPRGNFPKFGSPCFIVSIHRKKKISFILTSPKMGVPSKTCTKFLRKFLRSRRECQIFVIIDVNTDLLNFADRAWRKSCEGQRESQKCSYERKWTSEVDVNTAHGPRKRMLPE